MHVKAFITSFVEIVDVMDSLGIGIVGIGHWSGMHAAALKKTKSLHLVTCYTRTEEKGKKFASQNNCNYDKSYEEVLKRNDVDAIILTTPHTTHLDLAVKAAQAGKHLLIEKPMANTVAECKKMIDAFEKAGLVLSVCQDRRWTGYHRKMKEIISSGQVGRTIFAEGNFFNPSGLNITPEKWRWYKSESPGGPLAYLGVHMIDTLRYLVDPSVDEVSAFLDKLVLKAEIDDIALLSLKFGNGSYGFTTSVFTTPRQVYTNLFGTGMNLFADEKAGLFSQKAGTETRERVEFENLDPIQGEEEDFALSVLEKRKPEVDGYEGMKNVAVVEAAIKSSKERRSVKLSEIMD
jgi:predicted dehydrogenase